MILPVPTPSPDKRFIFPRADYYVDSDGIRQIPNAASHFLDGSMVCPPIAQAAVGVVRTLPPTLQVVQVYILPSLFFSACTKKSACLSLFPSLFEKLLKLWANHGKVVCCM